MRYRMAIVRAAMLTGATMAVTAGCSRYQKHRQPLPVVVEKPVEAPTPRVMDYSSRPSPVAKGLPTALGPVTPLPQPPRTAAAKPAANEKRPTPALMQPLKPPSVVMEKSPEKGKEKVLEYLPPVKPETTAITPTPTMRPERLPAPTMGPVPPLEPTRPTSTIVPVPPETSLIVPEPPAKTPTKTVAPDPAPKVTPAAAPTPATLPVIPAAQTVPPKAEPPSAPAEKRLPDLVDPVGVKPLPEPAAVQSPVLPTIPDGDKFSAPNPPLPALTPSSTVPQPLPEPSALKAPPLPTIPVPPVDPSLPSLAARPDPEAKPLEVPKLAPALVPSQIETAPKASAEPPKPAPAPVPADVSLGDKFDTTPDARAPLPKAMPSRPVAPAPTPVATAPTPEPSVPLMGNTPTGPLSLTDAVAMAHRLQPRLRVFLESIVQAEGDEKVAQAAFLPTAAIGLGVGGYDLHVGGKGAPAGAPGTNFNFLPQTGALPVGLNMSSGYEVAELKVQWLLTDFGRRMGRYRQAQLGVDVASLQTDRAYETVAHEVAAAYYNVLRTRALHSTLEDSVKRAEADLESVRRLQKTGLVEREKVLRAEVQVAQAKRTLDAVDAAAATALSSLNLAIGLNVNCPTEVVCETFVPRFDLDLAHCLEEAIANRRELAVAQRSIQMAQEGLKVAKADFRPRVVADGGLLDFQQGGPRGNADLAVGAIKLEWGLFEGGRRIGEVRIADSKVRAAAAQAEVMADTIAFQVSDAYRQLIAAKRGIERARPALGQARETYRITAAKLKQGDASIIDAADAENALARAEQDLLNSSFDYLIGLSRLQFAMGLPAIPGK